MTGKPGDLEAAYALGRELGRGAFGQVLEGKALSTGHAVAIKLPLAPPDPAQRARIEREAKLLAGLSHPRLARFHGLLLDQAGLPALVYDLVPGRSLEAELAAAGRLAPDAVLPLVAGIAEGLEALHAAGLMHRDLKPANVMVTPEGLVVLLDYGLARPVGEGQTLTKTGTVMGTPAYLAPEQLSGARLGPPADVYALACIAFELLVGHPPFDGTTMEVVEAHLEAEPPRASDQVPGLPRGLDRVLRAALAKDPAERPASAVGLVDELQAVLGAPRAGATRELDRDGPTRSLGRGAPAGPAATVDGTAPAPGIARAGARPGGPGWVRPLAVAAGVLALGITARLLLPRDSPAGPVPGADPGPAGEPPATAADLEAFLAGAARDDLVHRFLSLPGNTPAPEAFEVRATARAVFESRARSRNLLELLERLRQTPPDPALGIAVARLLRTVWPLAVAKAPDADSAIAERPLLDGRLLPAIDALAARVMRYRREPRLSFYAAIDAAESRDFLLGEERRRGLHEELRRRGDGEVDPLALATLGTGGSRWELLHGVSLDTGLPGSGRAYLARVKSQGPTGIPALYLDEPLDTGLDNRAHTTTEAEVPLRRPAEGDLVLGLAAYYLNPGVPTFVVTFAFEDGAGQPVGEVAYPLAGPIWPGSEALLPGGEPLLKRAGHLIRIRREVVPESTRHLKVRVHTLQATGVANEFLGLQQLLVLRSGPTPAGLAGDWEEGTPRPLLAGAEEAVQRTWARLARAPGLVGALALAGVPDDALLRTWHQGRAAFAAATGDLGSALAELDPDRIDAATLATLSWLRLVRQVLEVHRFKDLEPLLPPDQDPGLEAAIGQAVRVDPLPAASTGPGPAWVRPKPLAAFVATEVAAGRRWKPLRTLPMPPAPPGPEVRVLTPLGGRADATLTGIWSGADLPAGPDRSRAATGEATGRIRLDLDPVPGDLVLAFELADWNRPRPAQALRLAIAGESTETEVVLFPVDPHGTQELPDGSFYPLFGLTVRIRRSALPGIPRRLALTAHALRPIADDSASVEVHDVYQLVAGEPGPMRPATMDP